MNKNIGKKNILSDKCKHLVKVIDQTTVKLVQRLEGKSRKVITTTIT